MIRILFMLSMLLMFSNFAWADDIVATWKINEGRPIKLSYRDDTHIRMETVNGGYLLVAGENAYVVDNDNGQWQAVDTKMIAGMIKAFGTPDLNSIENDVEFDQTELKDSGRTEVVAGYKGKVYLSKQEQDDGSIKDVEIVLSPHGDIKKINQGLAILASRMGAMVGQDMADIINQTSDQSPNGGLLRYSDSIKLEQLEKKDLGEAYFQLPKDVTLVQNPNESIDATQETSQKTSSPPSNEKDAVSDSTSASETDSDGSGEMEEELKKGVRNLIKGLF